MNVLSVEDPSLTFGINADNNELEVSLYGATQQSYFDFAWGAIFGRCFFEEVKDL